MLRLRPLTLALAPLCLLLLVAATPAAAQPTLTREWRDSDVWYDGKAEVAVYDATRVIYGQRREYTATLYTNKEYLDPSTRTKASSSDIEGAVEVFKHHMREDIPTENYKYHYSTMTYVGTEDMKAWKLDMGSQEDCGATFKQFWARGAAEGAEAAEGGEQLGGESPGRERERAEEPGVQWHQYSYFPNEGHQAGLIATAEEGDAGPLVFQDALSLILRGYPFKNPSERMMLGMVPDQTWTKLTDVEPVGVGVRYVGRETLRLPMGEVEAYHVQVPLQAEAALAGDASREGGGGEGGGMIQHDYWFAVDGSPPMLHALVQYAGPDPAGNPITLRLRSLERRAYWER